ncbi:MAG: hypothetical protein HZB37_07195 [Planctomycetes bacterium]|nr:hypothetical protein [Planctomycetota bacterium]
MIVIHTIRKLLRDVDTIIILGFALLSLLLLFHHEPWRDEAQAWLIARDCSSIGALICQMGYEGTPALWHVILFLPAQLGLPYRSMFVVHFLIIATAVVTFMRYAPFSRVQKILFVFGYYTLYEYNTIARNYAVSVMLLFFIATMYKNRFERPVVYSLLIFLLANSNVHSLAISMALAGMYFLEIACKGVASLKKQHVLSFCIFAAGFFVSIYQLTPPKDLAPSFAKWYLDVDRKQYTYVITTAINNAFSVKFLCENVRYGLVFLFGDNFFVKYLFFTFPLNLLLSCLILFVTAGCMIKKPEPLLVFLVSLISLVVIFCFKSAGDSRHHGFIFITFIFCLWIANTYRERSCSVFRGFSLKWIYNQRFLWISVIFSFSTIRSCQAFYQELQYDFSAGKRTANFLTKEKLVNNKTFIATYPSSASLSIVPFIPKPYSQLYSIEQERYRSFMIWDKEWFLASYALPHGCRDAKPLKSIYDCLSPDALPLDEIPKRVDRATTGKDYGAVLLILNRDVEDAGDFLEKYRLIAHFADTLVKDESFYLYQKIAAPELWNNGF